LSKKSSRLFLPQSRKEIEERKQRDGILNKSFFLSLLFLRLCGGQDFSLFSP